ncbi:PAS domain S-box protein [Aliiglaciecola sp. CAU 1673]|uniref:PAS domain S-box protein n=1 Tax=Aliiglaciecola sp. CAU 1673 TaxID=3032595 RepID=UPI0023DA0586|nr:PAS domain S-box protein [Aliiglaciecola sp. CAU 1673]MDF2178872.1 PAS domain S-box protein [Aliiglaciecola sp. CAU 1673]
MSDTGLISEESILQSLHTGVVVHAPDSRILYSNPRAAELLGLTMDQMHGRDALDPTWQFIDEHYQPLKIEDYPVSRVLSSDKSLENMVLGIISPMHQHCVWVLVTANPCFDANDMLTHVIINFHDVSHQKNLEEALRQQTNRYKELLRNTSDGMCIVNAQGYVEEASDSWCEMIGYERDQAIGMHVGQWDAQFSQEELISLIEEIFSGNRRVQFETVHRRQDGTTATVEVSAVPVVIEDRSVLYCTTRDISARKKAEQELKDTLLRLNESIKAANVGLWDWDLTNNRVTYSKEYKSQIGYTENEIENDFNEWQSRVHPDDVDGALEQAQKSIEDGSENYEAEFRFRHKDGSYRWMFAHASILKDDQGCPVRMVGSHIDITERKRLEEELRHSQKMEAVGQLAGGVAHDFNNQLATIMGFAELLKDELQHSDLIEYVNKIITAAEHSTSLTNQLLAFSRKKSLKLEIVDINQLLEDLVELLRRSIDKKVDIRLSLNSEQFYVNGDNSLVQNAFLNLGLNARDAIKNGGCISISTKAVKIAAVNVEDAVSNQSKNEYIRIDFRDTGCGISEEDLPRLFEPFFTTKEVGKGTGMGLASAYGAFKQLGGYIEVDSKIGMGSCFSVFLPLAESVKYQTESTEQRNNDTLMESKTVMFVDDEPDIRELFASFLKVLGHQSVFASDGAEAIGLYQEHRDKIDLVILDMIMPIMNGKDTFMEMKKINPNVKVVVASGYTAENSVTEMIELGVCEVISKPFKLDEIKDCINKFSS